VIWAKAILLEGVLNVKQIFSSALYKIQSKTTRVLHNSLTAGLHRFYIIAPSHLPGQSDSIFSKQTLI